MKLYNSKKNPRKMDFPAICRPKFLDFPLLCLLWGHPTEPLNLANSKEDESLGKNGCRIKIKSIQYQNKKTLQTSKEIHSMHWGISPPQALL